MLHFISVTNRCLLVWLKRDKEEGWSALDDGLNLCQNNIPLSIEVYCLYRIYTGAQLIYAWCLGVKKRAGWHHQKRQNKFDREWTTYKQRDYHNETGNHWRSQWGSRDKLRLCAFSEVVGGLSVPALVLEDHRNPENETERASGCCNFLRKLTLYSNEF